MAKRKEDVPEQLYHAEVRLISCLKRNVRCILDTQVPSGLDATTYNKKLIRAKFLRRIILDDEFRGLIPSRGLEIHGAWISGNLDFEHELVSTPLHFENCVFTGELVFTGAKIANLCLKGSKVYHLNLSDAQCSGNIILSKGFRTNTPVFARALKVTGQLGCSGGAFLGHRLAISLESAKIDEEFFWRHMKNGPFGVVDLTNASVSMLIDDRQSWPKKGKLHIAGFTYSQLGSNTDSNYFDRIEWLERQNEPHLDFDFRPQPFEQLYSVMSSSGREDMAKKVAIKKLDYQRRATRRQSNRRLIELLNQKKVEVDPFRLKILELSIKQAERRSIGNTLVKLPANFKWLFSYIFGLVCGYGYRPSRCLIVSFLFLICGSFIFGLGFEKGRITPKNPLVMTTVWADAKTTANPSRTFYDAVPDYPKFNAIAFAADAFIPLVDLGQEDYWSVTSSTKSIFTTSFSLWFFWFYVLSGWILTAIFAASVSGLVRR